MKDFPLASKICDTIWYSRLGKRQQWYWACTCRHVLSDLRVIHNVESTARPYATLQRTHFTFASGHRNVHRRKDEERTMHYSQVQGKCLLQPQKTPRVQPALPPTCRLQGRGSSIEGCRSSIRLQSQLRRRWSLSMPATWSLTQL